MFVKGVSSAFLFFILFAMILRMHLFVRFSVIFPSFNFLMAVIFLLVFFHLFWSSWWFISWGRIVGAGLRNCLVFVIAFILTVFLFTSFLFLAGRFFRLFWEIWFCFLFSFVLFYFAIACVCFVRSWYNNCGFLISMFSWSFKLFLFWCSLFDSWMSVGFIVIHSAVSAKSTVVL